jgi:hypothetical protein
MLSVRGEYGMNTESDWMNAAHSTGVSFLTQKDALRLEKLHDSSF